MSKSLKASIATPVVRRGRKITVLIKRFKEGRIAPMRAMGEGKVWLAAVGQVLSVSLLPLIPITKEDDHDLS